MKHKIIFLIVFLLFSGQVWADQDTLRPTADNGKLDWIDYPSAGSDWEKIDDVTPDGDATYLWATGTGSSYRQGWIHTAWTVSDNIDSVRSTVRMKSVGSAGSPKVLLGRQKHLGEGIWGWCANAGADTVTVTVTSSYTDYSIVWANDPYDGSAWDTTKLNNDERAWGFQNVELGWDPDSFGIYSSATSWGPHPTDRLDAMVFTMTSTDAILESLRIKIDDATPNADVKMAIYTDSAGFPDDKIWGDETGQTLIDDLNSVAASGNVSADDSLWLCFKVSTTTDTIWYGASEPGNPHRWSTESHAHYDSVWRDDYEPEDFTNSNAFRYMMSAIVGYEQQNRATQADIIVYYPEAEVAGKARERRIKNLQEANE